MPMNQEIKAQWVAALKSGDYEQGQMYLTSIFREDGEEKRKYCCLGVLCDLAIKAGVQLSVEDRRPLFSDFCVSYDNETGLLPWEVRVWAGLDEMNPEVTKDGARYALAVLNDGETEDEYTDAVRQHDFHEIADLIEAQL